MRMLNQPDKSAEGVSILRLDSQEGDNSQSIEVCTISRVRVMVFNATFNNILVILV
jgi:uncharacterized protein (UPF0248 family)